jgi:hypothetical protein
VLLIRGFAAGLIALCACSGDEKPPPGPKTDAGPVGTDAGPLDGGVANCPEQHLLGDAGAPIELQLVALVPGVGLTVLADGAQVPLSQPPQGGRVIYAGARARNLNACGVVMSAHLLDPDGGVAISGLDQRPADLDLEAGGFYGPSEDALIFELPNIPACPDFLGRGVAAMDAILEVTVTDTEGKTAKAALRVVPTCDTADLECPCMCGPDFKPGGC